MAFVSCDAGGSGRARQLPSALPKPIAEIIRNLDLGAYIRGSMEAYGDLQFESVVEALLAVTAEMLVEGSFSLDVPIEVFVLPLLVGRLAAV